MSLESMTIWEMFLSRVNKTPDKTAFTYKNASCTWKELLSISESCAANFIKQGIRKGNHVGILSINTPEWIGSFLALSHVGAVSVLINPCLKRYELESTLAYADVEYLCFGDGSQEKAFIDTIETMDMSKLPRLKKFLSMGHRNCVNGNMPEHGQLSEGDAGILQKAGVEVKPQDILSIMFTSGTTSCVKGVTVDNFTCVNLAAEVIWQMRWNESDKICIAIPLFHNFGLVTGLLAGIYGGISIYLVDNNRTVNIMECMERNKCTILSGVPTMFMAMIRNPDRRKYDLSSWKSGIIGGSPICPEDYLQICREFGVEKLQPSYGQTEASSCITFCDYDDSILQKSKSVGKPIRHLTIQIASLKSGERQPAGVTGEILIKGYNVMPGYYRMPDEMKKVFDKDGWLHTGDIGFMDEDGNLHITGRTKEMVIRCGENISPYEIEASIRTYPGIKNVKVIGIPEEVTQEEIAACIIVNEKEVIDKHKLREYLAERLAKYKVPKYIVVMEEFPMSVTGKILLKDLQEQAINLSNALRPLPLKAGDKPISASVVGSISH